ncbi:MAG: hypothetical protein AMXMBFR57_18940 [Acidimicrobiia bacterium]
MAQSATNRRKNPDPMDSPKREEPKARSVEGSAGIPQDQGPPKGDRGEHGKTWEPPSGEQGISNREDDEGR